MIKRDIGRVFRHHDAVFFLLILVLLCGAGLRIYHLGRCNLWYDEATSVYAIKNFDRIHLTFQPPLYHILLYFWTRVFGEGEFALRFLSLIFSVCSIYMIYKLGGLFFDKKIGLLSAFILSISPVHIWYAQEVREYSMLSFLVMVSVYLFIKALKEDRYYLWLWFVIASTLSLYTNYFYLFLILASGSLLILKPYRPLIKKWLISCIIILILFIPWLNVFFKHFVSVKEVFWVSKPNLGSIQFTFENFILGYNATALNYFFGLILFSILFLFGVFYCKKYKQSLVSLLLFLCIPIALSFIFSQWIPVYLDRQNIAVSPFYYIIISCGLKKIGRNHIAKVSFLSFFIILCALSLYNYYKDFMPLGYTNDHPVGVCPKKDFKGIANYIRNNLREGDVIAHTSLSGTTPVWYYLRDCHSVDEYYFVFYPAEDKYWQRELYRREKEAEQKCERPWIINLEHGITKYNFKRIWLISSPWLEPGLLEQNSLAVKKFVERHYVRLEGREFDGVVVGLYRKPD